MRGSYFKANFRIARKAKKNILLMGLLIIFVIFFLLVVEVQNLGDNYRQWRSYYDSLEVNISYFDSSLLRKQEYKETYDNLNKQEAGIFTLQNGEVFNDPQTYLEGMQDLLQTMLNGYGNHYRGAPTLNVPPKYQLHQRLVTYRYLYHHHIPVGMNSKNSVTYLIYIINLVAIYLFFYILLIASDTWMMKLDHATVLQNIPYKVEDEAKGKVLINLILTLGPLMFALIGAYLFAGLRNGFRSLNYPNVFYFNKIMAIPIWLDCLFLILYVAVLVVFVTCLSLFLNQLTKNVYLTVLGGIALYVLTYLPNRLFKFITWLPSPYLNINALFAGTVANRAGVPQLNLLTGAIILLVWSALLFMLFKYMVNKGRKVR